jgi:hypothetical protein
VAVAPTAAYDLIVLGWGRYAGVTRAVRAPAAPSEVWLRSHGRRQLAALSAALESAERNPGYRRAADAYDAGALLAARPQVLLDLVAVIVLARDGLIAIADATSKPAPPCFANPLHGRAAKRSQWPTRWISSPHQVVPLCASCSRSRANFDRRILLAPGYDGRQVPYFQVAGFWGRTGFGAFEADFPRHVLEHLKVA